MTLITQTEFKERRAHFFKKMIPNSIAIIPSAQEYLRNGDGHYQYRQNSDFYYLTGFDEPEAVAVFIKGQFILFNRPRDPLMEIWHGRREGQEGALKNYGADETYPFELFNEKLLELLTNCDTIYFAFGRQLHWDKILNHALNTLRQKVRGGVSAPQTIMNPEIYVHEMRLYKSAAEIKTMQKANDISIQAHIAAMKTCKPGKYEYELQAAILNEATRHGSFSQAYYPIIGSGENSCILHYHENNRKIENGDIVLVDAGCEFENYASDITRSFPANGKFSPEQKAIYEIVLNAQLAAIEDVKPNTPWPTMQGTIITIITEGLMALKIINDPADYKQFYMHNAGHWLGLDTHDAGNYKPNEWRKLAPGMVLTVEPGIYIAPNNPRVDKKWWGIGIRIEDDVLVTPHGHENLTDKLPKNINDIENLMK